MSSMLKITEEWVSEALIVHLEGDLSREAETLLMKPFPWEAEAYGRRSCLIFDLTAVDYINSGGMALLIRLTRAARKNAIHSFAYGVQPHYHKLFRMVGLTDALMIYPDLDSILHRLSELNNAD